jgi:hypothetical protein
MREFSGSHNFDALYQGTTSVGPFRPNKDLGFTGCGKTPLFEGDGLQAVHNSLKTSPALAAEGAVSAFKRLFPQPV